MSESKHPAWTLVTQDCQTFSLQLFHSQLHRALDGDTMSETASCNALSPWQPWRNESQRLGNTGHQDYNLPRPELGPQLKNIIVAWLVENKGTQILRKLPLPESIGWLLSLKHPSPEPHHKLREINSRGVPKKRDKLT